MKSVTQIVITLLSVLVLFSPISTAQKKTVVVNFSDSGAQQLVRTFSRSVQHLADSAGRLARHHADSLRSASSIRASAVTTRLDALTESLIASARDSLDLSRKDTLRFATTTFRRQVLAYGDTSQQAVASTLDDFLGQLSKGKNAYSMCDSCNNIHDFNDRLEEFRDFVTTLHETYRDTTLSLVEYQQDVFQDRFENARDSLLDLRGYLIDNRLGDIDYQRYFATRVVISAGYSNHVNYRGRDNGVSQQMLAPSIAFHHSSGFGVQVSSSFLDQSPIRLDNVTLRGDYQFALGDLLGFDLSYSHFWFSDSSKSSESVFTDDIGASISLHWPVLTVGIDGNLALGSASEFTIAPSLSHAFEIPLTLYDRITIEPTLTASIGQQNSSLTTLRTIAGKGKKVGSVQTQTVTSNTFGVLAYDASIPVTIEWGPATLVPEVHYVIPVNVIDLSTTNAFVSFNFTVSINVR